jgi:predicted alpha/beta hydrolase family esterase
VRAALLVAPGDAEQESLRPVLPSWSPIVRRPLPFASRLVASGDDPYCTLHRAQGLARDWGSDWVDYGERGHINAQSGLGLWPEGFGWVQDMAAHKPT